MADQDVIDVLALHPATHYDVQVRECERRNRTPVVGQLRDAAITLAMDVHERGKPATNEELERSFNRLKVPKSSRASLTQLWRALEGAPESK
jgi:hypothetical protein